ncbi:VWA domain-containing protein [Aggregatibacter actinomycetemcomitans]|nr:VWA domain-containing protein [Aggregatibacter actinomycetemcomitans]
MKSFKLSAVALCMGLMANAALADEPLKQEGKKTLYQRVLSTPTCQLTESAGATTGKKQPAFSRFYVYQRQNVSGKEWLKVGPDSFGKTVGWLDADCTVAWNMQMTLAFTNPVDREPLLFFKSKADIENVVNADDAKKILAPIRADLANNKTPAQIVAQEPKEFVDFQKNFYLLPILQGEEVMNAQGFYERILEVASVTKNDPSVKQEEKTQADPKSTKTGDPKNKNEPQVLTGFSAAVVFVVDASISMDPYINRTRDVIKQVSEQIEKEKLGKQVKFGLVGFRSSTKAVPGLEYVSKMFVDPSTVKDTQDFLRKAAELKQAKVSSKEFSEDSFAGISQALNEINWNNFGGRYIVLVTDAGALDGNNPLSSTGMDAKQLRLEAQHRGVAIYTLHLKTPSGVKNHEQAKNQYTDLSFNNYLNKPLYYAVNAGDVNEFGEKANALAKALTAQVKLAYQGENAAGTVIDEPKQEKAKTDMEKDAELLGKAMQLAYLGDKNGTKAPPVFKAWISDKDFVKPTVPTAEARVLMTKAQLSDLSDVVKKIADAANEGLISPDSMFAQLRSVAAAMGQDPNKLKQENATKLGELGLLGEYLDGIPYKSQVTGLDEQVWKGMSALEQEKFIRDLNSKLRHYRVFNEDQSRWISLSEGSDPRDYVYPVPLEALP